MKTFVRCGVGWAVVVAVVGLMAVGAGTVQAGTVYVSTAGNDTNDGLSWPTAKLTVQAGLNAAVSGDQVWVAAGTYKPDRDAAHPSGTGDRTATFQLRNGVGLYGGFAGTEDPATFNPASRDLVANLTILGGDLAGNDGPNFANNGENSYHVVTGSGTGATAVLDGFTISGGNANGSGSPHGYGGGMYNSGGSPTLANCTFNGNTASSDGGGICCTSSSSPRLSNCTLSGNTGRSGGGILCTSSRPRLTNCTFSGNRARYSGGGICCDSSSPTLTGCTFSGNEASTYYGGGIYCSISSPTLTNCTFSGNTAYYGLGGGVYCSYASSPSLTNCTFSGNMASYGWGGGIYCYSSSPTLTNCTFSGNTARNGGGGICCDSAASPTLTNCILWGDSPQEIHVYSGTPNITYSDIQGGWPGQGNVNADPLFANPATGNYHLLPGSPCIDAGNNADVPPDAADLDGNGNTTEPLPLDLAGATRFADDPDTADAGAGTAPIVDMGAYEYHSGDANGDGHVDVLDLLYLVYSFGTLKGDAGFEPTCDFNHDGAVDVLDLLDLAYNFGT